MRNPRIRSLPALGALVLAGCAESKLEEASPHPSASEPARAVEPLPDSPNWVSAPVYRASGRLRASFGSEQRMTYCPYEVEREGNGSAVVTVTKPDGSMRKLFFSDGRGTGADTGETDPESFSSSKVGAMNIIRAGVEVYAIPDTVIYGG